jgi:hypothetical protein
MEEMDSSYKKRYPLDMGRGSNREALTQIPDVTRFGFDNLLPDSEEILLNNRKRYLKKLVATLNGESSEVARPYELFDERLLWGAIKDNDPAEEIAAYFKVAAISLCGAAEKNLHQSIRNFFAACGLGRTFSPFLVSKNDIIHIRKSGEERNTLCGLPIEAGYKPVMRGGFLEAQVISAEACRECQTKVRGFNGDIRRASEEGLAYHVVSDQEERHVVAKAAELLREESLRAIDKEEGARRNLIDMSIPMFGVIVREQCQLAAKYFLEADFLTRYHALFSLDSQTADASIAEVLGRAVEQAYGDDLALWPWPQQEALAKSYESLAANRSAGSGTIIRVATTAQMIAYHFPKAMPIFEKWRVVPEKEKQFPSVDRVLSVWEAAKFPN